MAMGISKLEPNYRKWCPKLVPDPPGKLAVKMDWRKLAEMHMEIEGTGMAPEAEAHLRTMAWWGKMSVSDRDEFKKRNNFFGDESATDANWRWIASIPSNVISALLHVNPTLFQDMGAFKKWLKVEGTQYQVPGSKL